MIPAFCYHHGMLNLLFDLDGTLYDFKATEKIALTIVLNTYGLENDRKTYDLYQEGNHYLWDEYEKGNISQSVINDRRFQMLFDRTGTKADGKEAGELYVEHLSRNGILLPGAKEFLDWLAARKDLFKAYIITNGIPKTQHGRLRTSDTYGYYEKIFISGEMGTQKPDKAFFDQVLEQAAIEKEDSIVIGDTEKSDIQGAINAGIRSIYINFEGKRSDMANYSVSSYDELEKLLLDLV